MHIQRRRNYADNNWNYDKLISALVTWTPTCLPNSQRVLVHYFCHSKHFIRLHRQNLTNKQKKTTETKEKQTLRLWIERSFAFIRCEFSFLIIFVRIFVRALMCSKNQKKKSTVYMCDIFQMYLFPHWMRSLYCPLFWFIEARKRIIFQ